jgi:hypothetical protein
MISITPLSRKRAAGPAVWLALLALWLQALLPTIHHPGSMFMPGMSMGSLCLAGGSAPATPHDKDQDHKLPPCPICQSLQILAAGYVPPTAVAIPLQTVVGIATAIFAPSVFRPSRRIESAQARAPPSPN